jgi:hypothetical protein
MSYICEENWLNPDYELDCMHSPDFWAMYRDKDYEDEEEEEQIEEDEDDYEDEDGEE